MQRLLLADELSDSPATPRSPSTPRGVPSTPKGGKKGSVEKLKSFRAGQHGTDDKAASNHDGWTFTSDVSESECVRLMLLAQGTSRHFRGFTMPEIERLANIFYFFSLSAGEDVVVAGEASSFFALIVNGRVDLILPPNPDGTDRFVPMYKGDTLGDISYFSGGVRTGTCRCKQNGTILAVRPTRRRAHSSTRELACAYALRQYQHDVPAVQPVLTRVAHEQRRIGLAELPYTDMMHRVHEHMH
jgi:hypothetical protein